MVRPPPVPVIASEKIPVDFPVATIRVDAVPLALGVAGLGLNVAVTPCGSPPTARLTGELKTPEEVTFTVSVPCYSLCAVYW